MSILTDKYTELTAQVATGNGTPVIFAELSQLSAAIAAEKAAEAAQTASPQPTDNSARLRVTVISGGKGERMVETNGSTSLRVVVEGLGWEPNDYAFRLRRADGAWAVVTAQYTLSTADLVDGKIEVLAAPNVDGGKYK